MAQNKKQRVIKSMFQLKRNEISLISRKWISDHYSPYTHTLARPYSFKTLSIHFFICYNRICSSNTSWANIYFNVRCRLPLEITRGHENDTVGVQIVSFQIGNETRRRNSRFFTSLSNKHIITIFIHTSSTLKTKTLNIWFEFPLSLKVLLWRAVIVCSRSEMIANW